MEKPVKERARIRAISSWPQRQTENNQNSLEEGCRKFDETRYRKKVGAQKNRKTEQQNLRARNIDKESASNLDLK